MEAPGGGGCTGGGPGEAGSGETGSCAQANAPISNKIQSKNPLRFMTKSEKMKRSVRNANYIPAFRLERHEAGSQRMTKFKTLMEFGFRERFLNVEAASPARRSFSEGGSAAKIGTLKSLPRYQS